MEPNVNPNANNPNYEKVNAATVEEALVSGIVDDGSSMVVVRSYCPSDLMAVRSICYNHFRSLCFPAVEYFIIEHYRDLLVLLIIGKIFSSWKILAFESFLFLVYLVVRARIELEMYIYRDCLDLLDPAKFYMIDDRSHFWVIEAPIEQRTNENSNSFKCIFNKAKSVFSSLRARLGLVNQPITGQDKINDSSSGGNCSVRTAVVGCVGCKPTRDDPQTVAQLLRLVVSRDARRHRNGSRLLAQFEHFARNAGFKSVRLHTNNLNTSHMKFLRQHGYEIVQFVSRTLMRGSLIQWKKDLTDFQKQLKMGGKSSNSRSTTSLLEGNTSTERGHRPRQSISTASMAMD